MGGPYEARLTPETHTRCHPWPVRADYNKSGRYCASLLLLPTVPVVSLSQGQGLAAICVAIFFCMSRIGGKALASSQKLLFVVLVASSSALPTPKNLQGSLSVQESPHHVLILHVENHLCLDLLYSQFFPFARFIMSFVACFRPDWYRITCTKLILDKTTESIIIFHLFTLLCTTTRNLR